MLMTVNPGFGGQTYIPGMTKKIRMLKDMLHERNLNVHIQVDGGIKTDNVRTVIEAGADRIVGGSSVFGKDTKGQIEEFQRTPKRLVNQEVTNMLEELKSVYMKQIWFYQSPVWYR